MTITDESDDGKQNCINSISIFFPSPWSQKRVNATSSRPSRYTAVHDDDDPAIGVTAAAGGVVADQVLGVVGVVVVVVVVGGVGPT
jgi:hypothetical protein